MFDPPPAILVTGGSRGLGCGIALELSESGFSVAVNFVTNAAAAQKPLMTAIKIRLTTSKNLLPCRPISAKREIART